MSRSVLELLDDTESTIGGFEPTIGPAKGAVLPIRRYGLFSHRLMTSYVVLARLQPNFPRDIDKIRKETRLVNQRLLELSTLANEMEACRGESFWSLWYLTRTSKILEDRRVTHSVI